MVTDERKLPKLASAKLLKDHIFEVIWSKGDRRGKSDVVNLLVLIDSFKVFKPLRNNHTLLESVHIVDDGVAIGFGGSDGVEVPAITLERLVAEQTMRAAQAAH
jgi:hypothetical protein